MNATPYPEPPVQPKSGFASILILAVTFLLAFAMILAYTAFFKAANSIKAAFSSSDKITQTFRSNLDKVISTRGNILELAVSEGDEYFRTEHERRAFGGNLYLGTTIAEIDARCTFRYHLQLSDPWKLDVRSNICVVYAPGFRASLPVAIQTDTMRTHAESGYLLFDKHDRLAELQRQMTGELARRAVDDQHVGSVRETCRQSVADFVRNWLMREDHWRADRFSTIIVNFPGEQLQLPAATFSDQRPVLRSTY